jgi:hypothetical protein
LGKDLRCIEKCVHACVLADGSASRLSKNTTAAAAVHSISNGGVGAGREEKRELAAGGQSQLSSSIRRVRSVSIW